MAAYWQVPLLYESDRLDSTEMEAQELRREWLGPHSQILIDRSISQLNSYGSKTRVLFPSQFHPKAGRLLRLTSSGCYPLRERNSKVTAVIQSTEPL